MLLSLNDDCLRLIGESLVFEDQISLAHVCKRLQFIVEDIWHHTSQKVSVTRDNCRFFKEHELFFYEFMRCISDNIEDLELDGIASSNLHSLSDLDFPKVKSLTISTLFGDRNNYDQDIKLFVKLFPQLTKLSICSGITGQFLWKLKNLDELHLTTCESLRTKYFKKIFTTLCLKKLTLLYYGYLTCLDGRILAIADCKTLEELYIDDHHLITIIDEALKLKRLHKITIYTRDYDAFLLDVISKCVGSAMSTMVFHDVFWSNDTHCESVKKMINLRRLILSEDDITYEQLQEIGKSLGSSLEELYLIKVRADEQGLLGLLSQCLNLKVFDVSNTSIDNQFVGRVSELIKSQRGKRNTPLLLRCYGTQVTKVELELLLPSEMLNFSLDKSPIELPGSRHFQCEWRNQCDD